MDVEISRPRCNIPKNFDQNIVRHSCIWTPLSRRLNSADLVVIEWELIKLLMDYLFIVFIIF